MKKRLMTAQLRYCSVVRIFLLLLCLSGGGNLWAETTYELRLGANNNASALESKNGGTYTTPSFFTISHTNNSANYNNKFAGYYEGVQYTHGLKIQSDTKISFTLAATSTVTIIQAKNSNSTENTKGIKFGITGSTTAYAYTDATTPSNVTGTTEDVRIYTFSNQAAGSYTIEKNDGETGLFYIKVVQQGDLTAPTSSFSNGNACAAVIPVGGSSTTVLNSFTTNSDGAVTWSVVNAGTTGATVSNASGTEGQVTVTGAGTCTIKAATAATSTYAADEKTYTLTVTQAGQFTVNVSDLKMLIPYGGVNANRNINRTIPRLDINFGGGDGVKFNQASQFLFRNSGTLQLVLRKGTDGEAANMTTIVLTGSFSNYDISGSHAITDYIQASSGTIVKTSDSQLTWTGFADDVTFTSQNLASVNISGFTVTHNGYPLNEAKETPSFSFSPSSQSALVTSSEEYATVYTSSPGFFDAVAFADGSTGTTIKANNPVAGGAGTSTATYTLVSGTTASGNATLTASFAGNDLFNAATTSTYTLTVTQASQDASWTYSADEKEIDGENRPYQGTVTFTSSGVIADGTKITDIPGLEVAFTAAGTVSNISTGNQNIYNGLALDGNGNVTFTPSVNGYLSIQGNFYINTSLGSISITNGNDTYYPTLTELTTPLIAGTTYILSATGDNFNLAAFTFRPAFLTPDETAEQTETFEANSATTEYPILVYSADAGVRFSGDRSVVNLSNEGDVTLVGGGTAVIRGKVISGENELTAYYTLHADVLSVASMTPTDGSTITTLDNSSVYIRFSDEIASTVDATKVVVLKDAQQLTGINVAKAGSSVSLHEKTLVLSNFPAMEAGSTYTIRLMSGCVSKKGASDVKNPEFIGTFTVESSEPPLNWVYPSTTSAVRISTSIVLQTSNKINESYPDGGVTGTLTYEGGDNDDDYLTAIKDGKNLVFKPTKPMVPNKLYTLTVGANQVKLDGSNSMITKDKVFMFTTGTATGSEPKLTSSTPANEAAIDLPANTDKINLYFDQNLELEPYSTVSIIPVNGSESLSRGNSEKLDDNGVLVAQNMTIDSEDPTHLSFEVGSDLKYDLYYEMIIPANIVTAPGGMPNNAYTVKFKINRNLNSTEVNASTFYPHTWDFNKFGNQTVATTTAYNIINNCGGSYTNSLIYDNSNFSYKTRNANNGFDQGNDVYFTNKNNEEEVMDEFVGIRISLNKPNCQRFELAQVTKEVQQETETQKVVVTNADGTTKWQFRMNGNTHYMTLSNVPAGKLYMVISSPYIGINSPNATFESVSGEGYTLENDNTLLNTNGTKKVVINVAQAGDVSFCVKNFTCEKIAVAADTKTFKTTFVKDNKTYASDRLSYDVRYDLLNAFTSHNVKAYYVSAITNKEGVNAADITGTQVDPKNAVKADQGILAVYQGAVSADTKVPIFKADVNTAALEVTANGEGSTLKNMLKVIGNDETTFPASEEGFYNYVLSPKGTKTTGVGFYRYTGSGFSPRAAYLPIPISYVNTGSGSGSTSSKGTRLLLLDADEQVATAILEVKGDGIATRNNDGYYYNLNGMRVDQPKAGIYIRNGKKVVVK